MVSWKDDIDVDLQIVSLPFFERQNMTIPVMPNDYFMATYWTTAYNISDLLRWQSKIYKKINPLIYFIQDFEPMFYPGSARYMLADSTYKFEFPIYAVINSKNLNDYFEKKAYAFTQKWFFTPKINLNLKNHLLADGSVTERKKQIIVYGRPSKPRNAFTILVYALILWAEKYEEAEQWEIISVGELHDDIVLKNNLKIHSYGKLSLQEYAKLMLEAYAGISLMISPHPSYPPLEMSTFGVKVITNMFDCKDINGFNNNIIALKNGSPNEIANELIKLCSNYNGYGSVSINSSYVNYMREFDNIPALLGKELEMNHKRGVVK